MFSPLQDALKKLRETKQAEQSQPKRVAVAEPSTSRPAPSQHHLAADNDVDIDLDDADLFDDLVVDDLGDDLAGDNLPERGGQPDEPQPSALSKFSYKPPPPDRPVLVASPRQPVTTPAGQQQQGGASSQVRMPVTPRPADKSAAGGGGGGGGGSRSAGQSRTITTTVIGNRAARRTAAAPEKQRIPGPAGILGEAASAGIVATTQKPASPFKTPLSRVVGGEQTGSVDFEGGTWAAMLDHLNMPTYTPSTAKSVVRTVEAAEWPIRRVLDVARTQRVRIMLVQLREMGSSDTDASVVMVDPTGEMEASIHRPVMKRFVHFLAAGASIILKDVVVMKVPDSRPFLVITAASIEQIFTSKGAGTREDPITLTATQTPSNVAQEPSKTATQASRSPSPVLLDGSDADDHNSEILASGDGVDALLDLLEPSP
ncbi:hypothetical protein H4R19_001734 [Coemansia spiralis]|nr:hypothetical protein H4R19_001734 [Coemansia spiralis]